MSLHTDRRQYGTDEERAEWLQELKSEYRREDPEKWYADNDGGLWRYDDDRGEVIKSE